MKKVAIIGSSGGNLFNLGGDKPVELLEKIINQAEVANITVEEIQFIGASSSMDRVKDSTQSSLYILEDEIIKKEFSGKLKDVNDEAKEKDKKISEKIKNGKIQGLILVSADPENTNKKAIEAAQSEGIPVVGTGGTSMSTVQSMGVNVISASGTTGTTNRTRAISYILALSKHWDLKYRPAIGNFQKVETSNLLRNINLKGIMITALPAFIAMALTLALSKIPQLSFLKDVFDVMIKSLPVVVATIATKKVSGLDEVAIVAGIITGALSVDGGILGGIAGGIMAGFLVTFLLSKCYEYNFPATTANIIAGGLAGLVAGLIIYFGLAPVSTALGNGIRDLIDASVNYSPILAGALAGLIIWPAIIGGFYHAAILPVILLEMEKTGSSFFGAIDMSGLVMVSAGITLANILMPKTKDERTVAAPGFLINMGFGTFVEAAYPFMFSDKIVFAGAIISSTISGAVAGILGVRGTAYVPSLVAPGLSNNPWGFAAAMATGLILSFLITLFANKMSLRKSTN
jgi:fructose-specific phosphotransferase system IIC component